MISNIDALTVLLLLYILSMIIPTDFNLKKCWTLELQNIPVNEIDSKRKMKMNLLNAEKKNYQEKEM